MKIREAVKIGVAVAFGKIAYDLTNAFYVAGVNSALKHLQKGKNK